MVGTIGWFGDPLDHDVFIAISNNCELTLWESGRIDVYRNVDFSHFNYLRWD